MSDKLKDLKTAERELRQLVNDVYATTHTCGSVYIQRLKEFIVTNNTVSEMLSVYEVQDTTTAKVNHGYNWNFIIPKDKTEHITQILGTIYELSSGVDPTRYFSGYKGHKKFNDCIQDGLRDLINPLYMLLSTKLREQIEELENASKVSLPMIGGDYIAGNKQHADGDIKIIDNSKTTTKTKTAFYRKEGFIGGVIAGIISGLAVWGITELIKFLIGG